MEVTNQEVLHGEEMVRLGADGYAAGDEASPPA